MEFMTTSLKNLDLDDYKKLSRVICYLCTTKALPLVLMAEEANITKWWFDSSFSVNNYMKSHIGGMI